jgi:hypothetical protein
MLLECQSCQKKLNISEEKIPFGRPFTFVCPSCKFKNSMTLPERRVTEISLEEGDPPDAAAAADPRKDPPPVPPPGATRMSQMAPVMPPELAPPPMEYDELPEGIKLAMIAFDNEEVQEKVSQMLSAMGFRVTAAVNVRDAVKQLKFGRFQLIVIQEDYYGASLASNQIIRGINSIELAVRHDMFVCVVGDGFTSLDDLTAFSLSLDTVVNSRDLDDLERIVISAMGHSKKFFQTYRELMVQRGVDYK